jgi:16S rRNA processing protein RimM
LTEEQLLLEVGVITKPHGLRGEVVVHLFSDLPERLEPGSVLETDRGDLEVISSKPHQGQFIVKFAGTDDRNGAEALRSVVLRAEPIDVEGVLWVHELIGCTVTSTRGEEFGTVRAVEQNPASDLLVTTTQHLVPLAFIVEHEPNVAIVVDVPEGFLDL